MKFILILCLLSQTCFSQTTDTSLISQKEVMKIANEVSKIIKNNSLFTDSLNWNFINEEVQKMSTTINKKEDLTLIYRFFIKQLRHVGDNHSNVLTQNMIKQIQSKPQVNKKVDKQAISKYLGDGVGYIKVPDCLYLESEKNKKYTKQLQSLIKNIDDENNITSWVIDLRNNEGGDASPMLAGLNCLIEDGIVAYAISPFHKRQIVWNSLNGKIKVGDTNFKYDNYKVKNINSTFAVLIDSTTASSGEIVAVSFCGIKNAKLFGVPSAGYITSNTRITISNGDMLLIADSYITDRNHKKYIDKIIPDMIVNPTNNIKDQTLAQAKKWLVDTK